MIRPSYLSVGDHIGIIALASRVEYDSSEAMLRLQLGIRTLLDWGLEVVEGETLKAQVRYHQFSATDEIRRRDFQQMLDNPAIRAILLVRGGYGCSRILDKLNFDKFLKNPKWIIGFSDSTAILSHLQKQYGVESLHAPMLNQFISSREAVNTLRATLLGQHLVYEDIQPHPFNRYGVAHGTVVGGNLCLLTHLMGSPSEIDTRGRLLFIEDVNEYYYNLDRMMVQLNRAGKLSQLSGLIVGQFTNLKESSIGTFGKYAYEIITEHVLAYDYPVCFNFPVGHIDDNRVMIVGREATLSVCHKTTKLHFHY